MGRVIRRNELHGRRARRMKLTKLRRRYSAAKTATERERILEKVARVAPQVSKEEFLAPLRAQRGAAKEAPSPAR